MCHVTLILFVRVEADAAGRLGTSPSSFRLSSTMRLFNMKQ